MDQEIKKTVTYLMEKNIHALSIQNNDVWYPIHIAAFGNLTIDIIFYMAKQVPHNYGSRGMIALTQAKVETVNDNSNSIIIIVFFVYTILCSIIIKLLLLHKHSLKRHKRMFISPIWNIQCNSETFENKNIPGT